MKKHYIQYNGVMIKATGAFENGRFFDGEFLQNNNGINTPTLSMLSILGAIDKKIYYVYPNGFDKDASIANGCYTNGFYINGLSSNQCAGYAFDVVNDSSIIRLYISSNDKDSFGNEYVDMISNSINYDIVTPAGAYSYTIDTNKLIPFPDASKGILFHLSAYDIQWPIVGTFLNGLTTVNSITSYFSNGLGSYYETISSSESVPTPLKIYPKNNNGQYINGYDGLSGLEVAIMYTEPPSPDSPNGNILNILYQSIFILIYEDNNYKYYPFYYPEFSDSSNTVPLLKYVTIKRFNKLTSGEELWDDELKKWTDLSGQTQFPIVVTVKNYLDEDLIIIIGYIEDGTETYVSGFNGDDVSSNIIKSDEIYDYYYQPYTIPPSDSVYNSVIRLSKLNYPTTPPNIWNLENNYWIP